MNFISELSNLFQSWKEFYLHFKDFFEKFGSTVCGGNYTIK